MTDPVEALTAALKQTEARTVTEHASVERMWDRHYGRRAADISAALRASGFDVVPTGGTPDFGVQYKETWTDWHIHRWACRRCGIDRPADVVPTGDAALDVERLARSFARVTTYIPVASDDPAKWHREWAAKVAAEYARLSSSDTGERR